MLLPHPCGVVVAGAVGGQKVLKKDDDANDHDSPDEDDDEEDHEYLDAPYFSGPHVCLLCVWAQSGRLSSLVLRRAEERRRAVVYTGKAAS